MGLFDFFKNKNKDNKAASTDESVISNVQEELQENTQKIHRMYRQKKYVKMKILLKVPKQVI